MRPNDDKRPGRLRLLGKAVLSAVLLGGLIASADLGAVWSVGRTAHLPLLVLAFLQFLIGYYLTAARWRVLLQAQGTQLGLGYLMQSFAVSVFFNNFLPSTVGGDVVRIYDTSRAGGSKVSALAALFLDRLIGLFALAMFALAGLALSRGFRQENVFFIPVVLAFVGLTLAMVLMAFYFPPRILSSLTSKMEKLPKWSGRRVVGRLLDATFLVRGKTELLFSTFGLSVLLQGNVILFHFLVGRSIDLPLGPADYALIVPLALVIMAIPVSINAVGLREGVFALLFGFHGLDLSHALAFSWLIYCQTLLRGLLGGVVYLLRRGPVKGLQKHRP